MTILIDRYIIPKVNLISTVFFAVFGDVVFFGSIKYTVRKSFVSAERNY